MQEEPKEDGERMFIEGTEGNRPIFLPWTSNSEKAEGANENCFESLRLFCCPRLGILQFISIISILEFIVFIVSLCLNGLSNESFLAP